MLDDFPRILSLLRQEKKISQRKASGDLEISQALLSHYENGVREPGLTFVARAAEYYDVSCDYLLGRTMNRAMNSVDAEELPDISKMKDNVLRGSALAMLQKKLMINSLALIMEITSKAEDKELLASVSSYMFAAIYRVYRWLYMANKENPEDFFPMPEDFFSEACDVWMKKCEIGLKSCATGRRPDGKKGKDLNIPELSHKALTEQYPMLAQSMLTLLHTVGEKLEDCK